MQPFNAPISDRKRQKFGEYMPRYERESSMRPFTAPISDWKRELFGTYMRRYETQPSMKPFDARISERSRELYGEYQARWSTQKIGQVVNSDMMDANGVNWVDITWGVGIKPLEDTTYSKAVYRYHASTMGGWAGTPYWRMLINDVKVHPFASEEPPALGATTSLGYLSMNVREGDVFKAQFRSTNAADGAGKLFLIRLDYVTFE